MDVSINQINFVEMCRICLAYASKTTNLLPIFVNKTSAKEYAGRKIEELEGNIPEMILACTGIEVEMKVIMYNFLIERNFR